MLQDPGKTQANSEEVENHNGNDLVPLLFEEVLVAVVECEVQLVEIDQNSAGLSDVVSGILLRLHFYIKHI